MTRTRMRGREEYRVWREIGTRWADNDAYGHVNNTVYYEWFDTVVNAWLIDQGLLRIASAELIFVVAETSCRYARSLAYPEPVEVGLVIERIGASSVHYRIGIFARGAQEAAAEGHFVHVCVAREDMRSRPIPSEWRSALRKISSEDESDDD
jgi:acyl-CoA thioester hydrolase